MPDRTRKPAMPTAIAPMLATLGPLPSGPGWAFELKWDGVRAVTYLTGGTLRVLSRNGIDVTGQYPELAAAAALPPGRDAVLDGEIVALDDVGHASFARLHERITSPTPARR
jgi:bifunctional non-homologous end joining protein LigD